MVDGFLAKSMLVHINASNYCLGSFSWLGRFEKLEESWEIGNVQEVQEIQV